MGSLEEFKACVDFVAKHRIVPDIDTVLEGLEAAPKGFVSSGADVLVCMHAYSQGLTPSSLPSPSTSSPHRASLAPQPLLADASKRSGGKVVLKIRAGRDAEVSEEERAAVGAAKL